MTEKDRQDFATKLKNHDWYYAYSDDHRYWSAGNRQSRELRSLHATLECPYDMSLLSKWAHNMIVEEFAEEAPNEWYRQPRKYKSIAPCNRDALITQLEWNEIQAWLDS